MQHPKKKKRKKERELKKAARGGGRQGSSPRNFERAGRSKLPRNRASESTQQLAHTRWINAAS